MTTNKTKPKKGKTCWVLTYEVNDYDQHGEYFAAVWDTKPTVQQLAAYFNSDKVKDKSIVGSNVPDALHFVLHLHEGGGRRNTEYIWYSLDEVEFAT